MEHFGCCGSWAECQAKGECVQLHYYNTEDFDCAIRNRLRGPQQPVGQPKDAAVKEQPQTAQKRPQEAAKKPVQKRLF